MTEKDIEHKVGAMHFRFLDDEDSYDTLLDSSTTIQAVTTNMEKPLLQR